MYKHNQTSFTFLKGKGHVKFVTESDQKLLFLLIIQQTLRLTIFWKVQNQTKDRKDNKKMAFLAVVSTGSCLVSQVFLRDR